MLTLPKAMGKIVSIARVPTAPLPWSKNLSLLICETYSLDLRFAPLELIVLLGIAQEA